MLDEVGHVLVGGILDDLLRRAALDDPAGKWVKIFGWKDAGVAKQLIREAVERAKAKK